MKPTQKTVPKLRKTLASTFGGGANRRSPLATWFRLHACVPLLWAVNTGEMPSVLWGLHLCTLQSQCRTCRTFHFIYCAPARLFVTYIVLTDAHHTQSHHAACICRQRALRLQRGHWCRRGRRDVSLRQLHYRHRLSRASDEHYRPDPERKSAMRRHCHALLKPRGADCVLISIADDDRRASACRLCDSGVENMSTKLPQDLNCTVVQTIQLRCPCRLFHGSTACMMKCKPCLWNQTGPSHQVLRSEWQAHPSNA